MKKVIKIAVVALFALLVVWVVYYLIQQSKTEPVVYQTESPQTATIIKKTVATGSVVPRKEILIKPQESGIIKKIYVEEGQILKKGDLIAQIQIIPDVVDVRNAESNVKKAEIAFANAEIDFARQKELFSTGVISKQEFQQAEMNYNNAKEDLSSSQDYLQLKIEGVTKNMTGTPNTSVRSTIDGMVLDIPVKEGNSVIKSNSFNDGTTVATMGDMNDMIFEGKVDETEVGKIKSGMQLILSIGAIDTTKYDATLEFIAPKGVEENGAIQFEIKAAVKLKANSFIRAGYSATADIVLEKRENVLGIKEKLITFAHDTASVEIEVKPKVYEKKIIKTGLSDGITIEVLEGLTKDDKIKVPAN